jgi:hypothetical protein
MKNVTITLDETTLRWARQHAVRQNVSLSRFVAELLDARMRESRAYDRAMQRYLDRPAVNLRAGDESYPTREELHDRAGLR